VLQRVLPRAGVVLELASGTGEHAAYFAPRLPYLDWRPSEVDPEMLRSIAAWSATANAANLLSPIQLDVRQPLAALPLSLLARVTAVVNVNMVHIAPWAACEGLMHVASSVLRTGGILFLYGPFKRDGRHTAPSNARFDEGLRRENPEWGVRDLGDLIQVADRHRLAHAETIAMPANNLSVVFRRV
jgi:SAM-dependent methyltransferase